MSPLSDDELAELLGHLESDRVERKRAWAGDAPEKARQAVCAFANDLPGHDQPGVLAIGVDDNGNPAGIPITDRLLQTLADIKTDGRILPPPTLTLERRTYRGVPIAVVTVWPADAPPVRFDGRIWIRIGPRRGTAGTQDERILNENWFDDRIEISNPGGPYGIVTKENFGRPGVADYRNPAIAAVLKTLGFVQRFGAGIAETHRALAANGNPPVQFEVEPTFVLATVRSAP